MSEMPVSRLSEYIAAPMLAGNSSPNGSVAPTPLRGRHAEAELIGKSLSAEVIEKCTAVARKEIAPITDVRASEAFRREMVGVMLRRMLERAARA